MKAFSIKQPWLDAILYGGKDPENRSWPIPARYLGVRVLLHASAPLDRHAVLPDGVDTSDWPGVRGAILGAATFVACHLDDGSCCARWGQRSGVKPVHHWQPADVIRLDGPVPAKGALQFWAPTPAVLDAVYRQIEAVPARPPRAPTDHVYKGRPDWAPSKLTPAQRADITRRLADGETPQALAAEYQVSGSTIRRHR